MFFFAFLVCLVVKIRRGDTLCTGAYNRTLRAIYIPS
jgi:hypothetical protein